MLVSRIADILKESDGLSLYDIIEKSNEKRGEVEKALDYMVLTGLIKKVKEQTVCSTCNGNCAGCSSLKMPDQYIYKM